MQQNPQRPRREGGVAFVLFFVLIGAAFGWLRLNTHLPLWAAVAILSPQTVLVLYALSGWIRRVDSSEPEHRKFEILAFLASGLSTFYLAFHAGAYLFLVYLYGSSRVQGEHLHFIKMPKGHAWIVSNGDQVAEGHFLHYLMVLGIWFALFFLAFPIIYWLLPKRDEGSAV
jgi:hypothetical protein